MDTGQNDLHAGITSMREEEVRKYIPNIINEFSLAIKVCVYNLSLFSGNTAILNLCEHLNKIV